MTAIDNPLNGYMEDGKYLGTFTCSPFMLENRNRVPVPRGRYWWMLVDNRFFDEGEIIEENDDE